MAPLTVLEMRVVKPHYLQMMGLNALQYEVEWRRLRRLSRSVGDADVVTLLRGPWRPRVMGAWLAAGREERVAEELLASLATSGGSLTAPPLAAVALHGLGGVSVPALLTYLDVDLRYQHGSAGFVAAVLETLGAPPSGVVVEDRHREQVRQMLAVAHRLATEANAGPGSAILRRLRRRTRAGDGFQGRLRPR